MHSYQETEIPSHDRSDRRSQMRADALDVLGAQVPTEGFAVEWLLDQSRQSGGLTQ